MKWVIRFIIIISFILVSFCISSVLADARKDLVFDLGDMDRDGPYHTPDIIANYHTSLPGKTSDGMSVWVSDPSVYNNPDALDYVFNGHLAQEQENNDLSPCDIGDECYYGKSVINPDYADLIYRINNYIVEISEYDENNKIDILSYGKKIADALSGPSTEPAQITYPEAWDTYWNNIAKKITQLEKEIADKTQQLDDTLAKQSMDQLSTEVPRESDSSYNEVELMNPSIENILSSGITNRDIQTINTQLNYLKNVQYEFLNNIDLRTDVESYSTSSMDNLIKKREKIETDLALLKSQADDELAIVNEIQTEIDKLMVNQAFGSDIVGSGNYYNTDDDSSSQSESYEKDPLGVIDMNGGEGLQAFQDAIDRQKEHDDKLLELKNKITDLEYSLKIVEHAIGINSIMNK